MQKEIPIFPLKLVVFPGSRYPLHIFEERYKAMVQKCIDEDTGFGIVSTIDKDISDVGVFVKVEKQVKKYNSGEFDVVVKGINRFKRLNIKEHYLGYFTADVIHYNDENDSINLELIDELRGKFEDLLEKANYKLEDDFWQNFRSVTVKSYKVAEKSGLSLDQQQELLLLKSENERLSYLISHFEKISEEISENAVLRSIVLSDGYLNESLE